MEEYMIPCLTKTFMGIPCPGCGGQRSVLHLIHGEFWDAFILYPAIYPLLILAGIFIFNYFKPNKLLSNLMSIFSLLSVALIVINYGVELNNFFELI